jgi:hypothetical protein
MILHNLARLSTLLLINAQLRYNTGCGEYSTESTSTSRYRTLHRKKYKIPLIGFIYLILVHPAVAIYVQNKNNEKIFYSFLIFFFLPLNKKISVTCDVASTVEGSSNGVLTDKISKLVLLLAIVFFAPSPPPPLPQ